MILFNDEIKDRNSIVVDIEDRGYQFGDGVYEVVRFYDRNCYQMNEHLERLERSADAIGLKLPYSIDKLKAYIHELITGSEIGTGNIYIQLTRGVAPRIHHFPENVSATVVAYVIGFERPTTQMENGVKAIVTEDIRWKRCDIKSINLLGSVLAKQEAKSQNAFEAILYREESGYITEGSSTNIFIVKDEKLYTHPANHWILNGITRTTVLFLAKKLGIHTVEEPFTLAALRGADEVFMTSTTAEITPIVTVDEMEYNGGEPGPITRRLQAAFTEQIK